MERGDDHEDWRNQLEKHLSSLKREKLITSWHDRKIIPGTEWEHEIHAHLQTAHIILLLISPDFIASDYCWGIELRTAMKRHNAGEAHVIPILIRPSDWKKAPFKKLQALPTDGKPVTTWPNPDEALLNVAQGIRKAVEEVKKNFITQVDTDITTSVVRKKNAAPTQIWAVPFQRNLLFTGRGDILTSLHTMLNTDTAAFRQAQVISGLGGIGKTQLAVEYAFHYKEDYQAVLWAEADSSESLTSAFVSFAKLLYPLGKREQDQKYAIDVVKGWLETNTNWLLILDNVEDVQVVYQYLPLVSTGHILLTTRMPITDGRAHLIELEKLEPEEGAHFLLRRANLVNASAAPENPPTPELTKAKAVVALLDGLPLALDQAGAYIEENGCGLSGYTELYERQQSRLMKKRGGFNTGHPEPVATTWSISFEKVEQANPTSAELLKFFSFLHPDAIPEELITKGASHLSPVLQAVAADPFMLKEAIGTLHTYSLVRRNPDETSLRLHRLVQAVLKDSMDEQMQKQWAEQTVRAVNQAFPRVEFATWSECLQLLPQAQQCAVLIEHWQMTFLDAARLLDETGYYLYEHAQYIEAELLLIRARVIREHVLGQDHLEVATSLNHLAELYREQSKYSQAEPLYQQALRVRKNHLGEVHADIATSCNNLANLYQAQGKYSQAEPLLQQALDIRQKVLAPEHSDVATSFNNLASLYRVHGKYSQAEPLFQQALSIKEKALGREHPETATALGNLASLYQDQGNYIQAKHLYQQKLKICQKLLGTKHPSTANALSGLATLYTKQRNFTEAEPLYQQALRICEQILEEEHPDTISILNNYIHMLRYAKRNTKAAELEERLRILQAKQI